MSSQPEAVNTGVKALTPHQLEYFARYLFAADHALFCNCLDDCPTGTDSSTNHHTDSPRVIAEWNLWWTELTVDHRAFWRERAQHAAFIAILLHKEMFHHPVYSHEGKRLPKDTNLAEFELSSLQEGTDNGD